MRKIQFYGQISTSNIFNYLTASEVFYTIHIILFNIIYYNIDQNTQVGLKLKFCTQILCLKTTLEAKFVSRISQII